MIQTDEDKLKALYSASQTEKWKIQKLTGGGSNRRYYRIFTSPDSSMIGVAGDNRREAAAFVSLTHLMWEKGMAVPEIYAYNEDLCAYTLEDLGNQSLFPLLHAEQGDSLMALALSELVKMQNISIGEVDSLIMTGIFGRRQVMWDLNYFKYCFLKPLDFPWDEEALENDMEDFAGLLTPFPEETMGFMYRDFQSRNVMVKDGKPYMIDYQGAWIGPCVYDAVSFLWQAKASLSNDCRKRMLDAYFLEMGNFRGEGTIVKMRSQVIPLAIFRTLQVLGAYGMRGLVEKKAHFIESISYALANLKDLLDNYPQYFGTELSRLCRLAIEEPRFKKDNPSSLQVDIFSFSYKKGYPADYTGNGGGFMFDCRGMENPGRYDEYKQLTGKDKPVIDFLEGKGEVQGFLEHAKGLVAPSIANYLRRGFKHLQIGFGCTGGQHRSVYCAEAMARYVSENFPEAIVKLTHREQQKQ